MEPTKMNFDQFLRIKDDGNILQKTKLHLDGIILTQDVLEKLSKLTNLETLVLEFEKLDETAQRFIFNRENKTKELAIHGFQIDFSKFGQSHENISSSSPIMTREAHFSPKLTELRLINKVGEKIALFGCENVEKLDLSGNINFPVQLVKFPRLVQLKWLSLTKNGIKEIDNKCFSGFENLSELDLSGNKLGNDVFSRLQCLGDVLVKLNLSENQIDSLLEDNLVNMPGLKELNLSRNNLNESNLNGLSELGNLTKLDLSSNEIAEFNEGFLFLKIKIDNNKVEYRGPLGLLELNLSHNRIGEINRYAFSKLKNLQLLDLSRNEIENRDNNDVLVFLEDLEDLEHLNLATNHLKEIVGCSLEKLKKLITFNLANNMISKIDGNSIRNLTALERIDLSGNQLESTENNNVFTQLKSLARPNLNCNLKVIKLSGNKLSELTKQDMEPFTNLEELDLNNNRISSISPNAFQLNEKLKKLYIANNCLVEWKNLKCIAHLKQIEELDSTGNGFKILYFYDLKGK